MRSVAEAVVFDIFLGDGVADEAGLFGDDLVLLVQTFDLAACKQGLDHVVNDLSLEGAALSVVVPVACKDLNGYTEKALQVPCAG